MTRGLPGEGTLLLPLAATRSRHQSHDRGDDSTKPEVTGVRFYKGAGSSGTHTGLLYSGTGTPLAQATFSGETASGWQQVNFSSAVSILADTTYIAAFFTTSGYAYNSNYFTSSATDSPPLHALRSGVDGLNSVYIYGATPQFPSSSFADSNYWVDVAFSGTVPTTLPLTADSVSPSSGNTANATLTAVYSDAAGYTDLGYVHLLINSSLSASNACYVAYQRSSNTLILLNDAGSGWLGPITAGAAGTLQNSQCVLNASGSSAAGSSSNLTLTVSATFKPSFTGSKTVFLYADGSGGLNSGWQSRGTWTVP